MKRFVFRYQTLLEVRERAEKQEQDVLSRLLTRQRAEEADTERFVQDEIALRAAWTEQVSGALDLDALLTMHSSLDGMARKIELQRHQAELAKAHTDNQREILAKVTQNAEIMRKLKQRDFDAWRAALEKAEAAFLDELATLRHTRTF
jgi:flagellar FliJ protein